MNRLLRIGIASLALPSIIGCSGAVASDADGYQDFEDSLGASESALVSRCHGKNQVCSTIAPPSCARLPHVTAAGAKAATIVKALDAILTAQTPPIRPGRRYSMTEVICGNLYVSMGGAQGHYCSLQVRINGGRVHKIGLEAPSDLAKDLFDALADSGAMTCDDMGHQYRIALKKVELSATRVQYDDASTYGTVPAPNVVVHGRDAKHIIRALAEAGIDDCDPMRKLALICNRFSGEPSCGVNWIPLERVGSSELLMACGAASGLPQPGGDISDAASLAIWNSILAGAAKAGYRPPSGTINQTTVINALWFSWDGAELGLTLTTGNTPLPDGPK